MRIPQAPGITGALRFILATSIAFGVAGTIAGNLSMATSDVAAIEDPSGDASRLPLLDIGAQTDPAASTNFSRFSQPALALSQPAPVVAPQTQSPQIVSLDDENSDLVMGSTLATALIEEGVVEIFDSPQGQSAWSLDVPTEFGGLRHFLVVGQSGDWLQIQVPVRPNGSTGWIQRSAVQLSNIRHRVQVDLSDRSVIVWEDDQIVLDTTGAVGRESAPTPLGSFYIRDIFEWKPESAYGPWVLALSSYSETIDQINGGDAVVAIHGTNDPWSLGDAVSLGCIRLDNEMVTQLAHLVGPGTPIEIVR